MGLGAADWNRWWQREDIKLDMSVTLGLPQNSACILERMCLPGGCAPQPCSPGACCTLFCGQRGEAGAHRGWPGRLHFPWPRSVLWGRLFVETTPKKTTWPNCRFPSILCPRFKQAPMRAVWLVLGRGWPHLVMASTVARVQGCCLDLAIKEPSRRLAVGMAGQVTDGS